MIIAGAGGAAHLPGMTAAKTTLPVLGVPVQSKTLGGLDSLLSIVQMPTGVPVATFAVGPAGAANAALCAASILANKHPAVAAALEKFRREQTAAVLAHPDPRMILWIPAALVVLFIGRGIGNFTQTYFMGYVCRRLVKQFRREVFEAVRRPAPERRRLTR